ncbi:MAG: DegT/DnrJ/EryC1/StrS family aminotransferase [Planctomycetota bacterium]|jgi:perosamine synthetase
MKIPLSKPSITRAEKNAVKRVMESGFISQGAETEAFENALAKLTARPEAVAVSSGTAGLHISLLAAGIGKGDEVITSPFTFVASANAILYAGAKIVFTDIEEENLCIDPAAVAEAAGAKTRAILPVHVFGALADMSAILETAKKHYLRVIEDACEAIGARRGNHVAGGAGDFGIFGFYPNKQITTGEGGAIVTGDPEAARILRSLRNQGRDEGVGALDHVRLGYNYRINEISAAIGRVQLERLDSILEQRARVATLYTERLSEISEIRTLGAVPDGTRSWFVYVIFLRESGKRADLANYLLENGIENRIYFPPVHLFPHIAEHGSFRKGQFPVTERTAASSLALPFHTEMKDEEVEYVCDKIAAFFQ